MRILLTVTTCIFFIASCTIRDKKPDVKAAPASDAYAKPNAMIKEAQLMLKSGDVVFRDGQEFSSQLIKNVNRKDKSYSHAGVVFFENGYPYIYHILPGEDNPGEKLRKDSLQRFCNPRKNFGFGIFRYNMEPAEIDKMQGLFGTWYKKELRFDSLFSLDSDDMMYCSEMIAKAIERSTGKRIRFNTTRLNSIEANYCAQKFKVPLERAQIPLVAMDNLTINPACTEIRRFQFTYQ
jgi:hypothetical protein